MSDGGGGGEQQEAEQIAGRTGGLPLLPALPLLGASLLTLAVLAVRIHEHRPPSWDGQLLRLLAGDPQAHAARPTQEVLVDLGGNYGLVLAGLVALGLVALGWKRAAFLCVLVAGMSIATVIGLKPAFDRPPLIDSRGGYFPSTHAAGSLAICAVLALVAWPTRWRWLVLAVGLVLVVLYGAALVHTRSHYPSDVVAGWCVALVWTCGLGLLIMR